MGLLALQTALVAMRRVRWHRRVGVFGAAWAALVVTLGCTTTLHAAIREVRGHTELATITVAIATLELVQMALSASLVIAAIRYELMMTPAWQAFGVRLLG